MISTVRGEPQATGAAPKLVAFGSPLNKVGKLP
jgi:hypothetical protein